MAHHRHQASLEGVLNFSRPHPLPADQRAHARQTFYTIINHCRDAELAAPPSPRQSRPTTYSRPLLVRYTYEYARSELSQDTFLAAFSASMDLDLAGDAPPDLERQGDQLGEKVASFAEFLMDNFFIPLKATGLRTAQPSPAHLSAIQRVQGNQHEYLPSPDRISVLRGTCLTRDHYRCVVSRLFDQNEAMARFKQQGDNAQDDEGNPLAEQSFAYLEVAHIIPHSLTKPEADGQLSDGKKAALAVLNMFDYDIVHLIDGANIDRPFNAMSLSQHLHTDFGRFSIFFDPIPGQEDTYRIDKFLPPALLPTIPVTRTLYLADNGSIDPPSSRLLAIHRAIAHILHLSGAGDYIDKILRDIEELGVQEGGETELGRIVALRLGGWLDGAVSV
ncbi:hypothetical protein FQN53_007243 [Emmonsiellopsis sp. PD_33]|nr:hypothetical protein FQN53_007243 [Emmonsiellopsis sp. PD_33]KAK2795868.1 hypothetical protein FQN51_000351 [Onygenales sp. PD_10]